MAIMLRQINAEIANLAYEFISPTKILVRGDIVKQILYVSNDEVVRHQNEVVPFTVTLELLGLAPGTALQVTADIEHISPRLIDNGTSVEQQIIVKITVAPGTGGPALSQQFLVRSITTIEEPATQVVLQEPEALNITAIPYSNPDTVDDLPTCDLTQLVESRLQELESQMRTELEQTLRMQIRREMELELEAHLAEEQLRREIAEREAERQKQEALNAYHKELTRKSVLQQLYGFKAKG